MNVANRQTLLIRRLRSIGVASVADLARDLGVAEATIRRDLRSLEVSGSVLRTYGGATLPTRERAPVADPMLARKRGIADAAASLVVDDQTIVIGSGSTTAEFARRLVERRLTVITNALDVVNIFVDQPRVELIVLGGFLRHGMHSLLGHLTEQAASELRADMLFMGIGAISLRQGLMNDLVAEILTDRALRRIARSVVLLADSSKFERVAPAFVFGLDEITTIVTDDGVRASIVEELESRGIRVIVAARPATAGREDA